MSERPLFIYAAIYGAYADALADYDSLLELHTDKLVRRELAEAEKQSASG